MQVRRTELQNNLKILFSFDYEEERKGKREEKRGEKKKQRATEENSIAK
jgi:hypothetical protein